MSGPARVARRVFVGDEAKKGLDLECSKHLTVNLREAGLHCAQAVAVEPLD